MLTRHPFGFYLILLSALTPAWVILRGFVGLDVAATAAILFPIVALLSAISTLRR